MVALRRPRAVHWLLLLPLATCQAYLSSSYPWTTACGFAGVLAGQRVACVPASYESVGSCWGLAYRKEEVADRTAGARSYRLPRTASACPATAEGILPSTCSTIGAASHYRSPCAWLTNMEAAGDAAASWMTAALTTVDDEAASWRIGAPVTSTYLACYSSATTWPGLSQSSPSGS